MYLYLRPQAFAKAYFEGTAVDEGEDEPVDVTVDPKLYRLSSTDVAEVLTFSLIMLHTDAHNPNIKKEKKMTMQQFVNNNRCVAGCVVILNLLELLSAA